MKGLKIFGVFILIAAVIAGVFMLPDIIGGNNHEETGEGQTRYEKLARRVESSWEVESIDIYDVFAINHYDIMQMKDEVGKTKIDVLRESNTRNALDKTHGLAKSVWAKAPCKQNDVNEVIVILDSICLVDSLAGYEENCKIVRRVNKAYRDARSFANSSIGCSPNFTGSSWSSFSNYADRIRNRKNNILNSSDYKEYLSNISEIKNGLNEMESKLSAARTVFYNRLASEIKDYFNAIEQSDRTDDQRINFSKVMNRYSDEYGSNPFASLYRQFRNDVEENSKKLQGYG